MAFWPLLLLLAAAGSYCGAPARAAGKLTVLNREHRIFLVDDFVSEVEIAHVVDVATKRLTAAAQQGDEEGFGGEVEARWVLVG